MSVVETPFNGVAFGAVYEAHYPNVMRYLTSQSGNPLVAEEIAADTFLRAAEKFSTFEDRGVPVTHWLISIARNAFVDHVRQGLRHPQEYLDDHPQLADRSATPYELIEGRINSEKLRATLLALPCNYRNILILRFVEKFSHEDTAAILGKSVVATRQTQIRALRAARKLMGDEEI